MEFKKPNSVAVKNGAALIGGATLGAMASRGVVGAIFTPTTSTDAAVIAKDANKLLMYRGAILVVAAAAAVALNGNDLGTTLAKGAFTGMAVMQTVEIVKDYAATKPSLAETTTGTKKFIAKSLGLACGCPTNNAGAMNGIYRRRAMRGIEMPTDSYVGNALDQAVQNGANV
jgi:hypothetical protein